MGRCGDWRQASNNWWEADICALENPQWVLGCTDGEGLCQVCGLAAFMMLLGVFNRSVKAISPLPWPPPTPHPTVGYVAPMLTWMLALCQRPWWTSQGGSTGHSSWMKPPLTCGTSFWGLPSPNPSWAVALLKGWVVLLNLSYPSPQSELSWVVARWSHCTSCLLCKS